MENKGFKKSFLWGGAVAANQCEGGSKLYNKGISLPDIQMYTKNSDRKKLNFNHVDKKTLEYLLNTENLYYPKRKGVEFFERYEEYFDLLEEMGFSCFRMSIAWSRIFPNGDEEKPNEEALKHYENMFKSLKRRKIKPIVTIFHYEMPLNLVTKYGGWDNKELINLFVKYSKVVLDRFNEYVEYFIPINQINLIQYESFGSLGILYDEKENYLERQFKGIHNQFVAFSMIKKYVKEKYPNVKLGTMLADCIVSPETCKPEDVELAFKRNRVQYFFGDVQIRGKYPRYILSYFEENNVNITITEEDAKLLKENTADFLCISYYYSYTVSKKKNTMRADDITRNEYLKENEWGWSINPSGFYVTISAYWDRYQIPIMIGENGFGFEDKLVDGTVHDQYRIEYLNEHIKALRRAVIDGVDLFAYCSWAPFDIVSAGTAEMTKRYGYIYVDYDDFGIGSGKLYKKDSFYWYKNLIENNGNLGDN